MNDQVLTPNLIIAGAPKCGTSSLYRWLADHPAICGSRPKETFFLMDPESPLRNPRCNYHEHGLAAYGSFFKHWSGEPLRLEATTHSMYQRTALNVLPTLPGPPRIVFVLREPAERALSSFRYTENNLGALRPGLSLARYLELARAEPHAINSFVRNPGSLFALQRDLVYGCYAEYLAMWRERFGEAAMHVMLFERLKRQPEVELKRLAEWLGIDATFYDDYKFSRENPTYAIRNRSLQFYARKLAPYLPRSAQRDQLKRAYYVMQAHEPEITELEAKLLAELRPLYEAHNERLAREWHLDLSPWQREVSGSAPSTRLSALDMRRFAALVRKEMVSMRLDMHSPAAIPVVFVIYQAGMRANGGLRSIQLVLARMRGVRAHVITNLESEWTEQVRNLGIAVTVLETLNVPEVHGAARAAQLVRVIQSSLAIYKIVRDERAKVVHCNDPQSLRSAALGARGAGARVVANLRAISAQAKPSMSHRWTAPLTALTVVLSKDMARRQRERVGPRLSIDYVYSIVELDKMRPLPPAERALLRRELGMADDAFVIGYAASFVRRKQQLELLQLGAAAILAAIPNAQLVFLGDSEADPEYGARCREVASALPAGRVHFPGYDANVQRWLAAWDATIVVSRDEGMARSMIESISCGTPVVSFDVPSAREIVEDHDCGFVVGGGDYAGLAERLSRLASDPALRQRLALQARSAAERLFDAEAAANRYVDIWRTVSGAAVVPSRAPVADAASPVVVRGRAAASPEADLASHEWRDPV